MADGFALLYPSDAEGSDNDFVVKCGSNCYEACGFPCHGTLLRVLSEEVQNLRHGSVWRNDRTSHVYYRVENLCVSKDIILTAKIRGDLVLDFFRSFSMILRSSSLNPEV